MELQYIEINPAMILLKTVDLFVIMLANIITNRSTVFSKIMAGFISIHTEVPCSYSLLNFILQHQLQIHCT